MSFIALAPLLHIAESAEHALRIRPDIVAGAALAFAAVLAGAWWPVLRRPLRKPLRAAAHVLVPVAVVAAVLPSVFPYDHVGPIDAGGDSQAHAAHCHVTPGSCADAPVSAGPGQFVFSDALLVVPALALVAIVVASATLVGRSPRPATRPPLAVVAG